MQQTVEVRYRAVADQLGGTAMVRSVPRAVISALPPPTIRPMFRESPRPISGIEHEAILYRDSALWRYVACGHGADSGCRSVSHRDINRHPERSVGLQRSGWRRDASALRRRRQ